VRLGVPTSMAKDIGHSGSRGRKVVYINFKLVLKLELLVIKGRISSIYK